MFKLFKTLKQAWEAEKERQEAEYVADRRAAYKLNTMMADAVDGAIRTVSDSRQIEQMVQDGRWTTPDHKETIKGDVAIAYTALTSAYTQAQESKHKLAPELQGIAALIPTVENNLESLENFANRVQDIRYQQEVARKQARKRTL